MMRARQPSTGFTLIEAAIVIAVTGIIAAIVAIFIVSPVKGYVLSTLHAQMTDAADATLRRLQRDVRLALPNSVRVTDSAGTAGSCIAGATTCFIEFIPTTSGALYRAQGDGSSGGNILNFTDTSSKTFDLLGIMPTPAPVAGANGDYVVVYNLGPNFSPANAYLLSSGQCATAGQGCNIAQIAQIGSGASNTITLSSNPFANQSPPLPSPNNRFQIVPNSGPVTYTCSPSAGAPVNRYTGYGWAVAQPTSFAVTPAVALSNAICVVDYAPAVLQRDGILFITINIIDAASGDKVTVFREIHVDNSP